MPFILSKKALQNLDEIAHYLERESGSQKTARNFIGQLLAKCKELASQPFPIGRIRPELGKEIRNYALGNYIIFFRYTAHRLEVITIMEGHRDIEDQFQLRH